MEPVRPRIDEAPEPYSGSTVDRLLTLADSPAEHTRVIDDFIHLAHAAAPQQDPAAQSRAKLPSAWPEWTFVGMALAVMGVCAVVFVYFIYGELH